MRARVGIGAVGVLVGAYGAYLLLGLGWDNLLAAVYWLAGGVILHDFVLSVALLGVALLVVAVVPARVRGPVVAGLVVLGSVTLLAVPVLGSFGAKADNPTLLDRNYWLGWVVLALLVVLATAVGVVRRLRTPASGPPDPEGTEREPEA
ncbi:hypothetical protein GCM10011519_00200 [Marmoricola endophyticus]|uniref:Uncharacterized protein n=1 Tax=Marmoricola endophyticus TaxID=2040280 RepID=A0A917BAA5_9ACTN|nr:hypothetical protein [Marmoricola endophyticus]GGF30731.1 hypothetical protein GCM10011519_00200 [Marmoricola endophyticus]